MFKLAEYPLLLPYYLLSIATFFAEISKAFPNLIVIFSSLGVCYMLSYPMNSSEPSLSSALKVLKVPFGKGMPSPLALVLLNWMLLEAFKFYSIYPPVLIEISLYFLTFTL
jgi:hypothetical protein